MTRTDIFHNEFATLPYWWQAAPPERSKSKMLPEEVDVAIIGGGYCGLSAAVELARAGTKVAVLDSGQIGIGASTRNGGLVSGAVKLEWTGFERRFGKDTARRLIEETRRSFEHLETLIKTEEFDVDYQRSGRFHVACNPAHFRTMQARAKELAALNHGDVHLVSRAEQRAEIGSDHFHGGLLIEPAGGLDPAKLHKSLRRLAKKEGAALHALAEVKNLIKDGRGLALETVRGRLRAEHVMVATNGYTGALIPALRRRIVPVSSYVIATEPLPGDLTNALSPKGRMFVDSNRLLTYFRLSPDGRRVLFGGRLHLRHVDEPAAAFGLYRYLVRIWPELAAFKITHAWKGCLGFTFDRLPHSGVLEGAHVAAGCNGSGVAMACYLGHQMAQKLLGRQTTPSAFEHVPFPVHPLYRHRPWFLPAVGVWYRLRDRIDAWRG